MRTVRVREERYCRSSAVLFYPLLLFHQSPHRPSFIITSYLFSTLNHRLGFIAAASRNNNGNFRPFKSTNSSCRRSSTSQPVVFFMLNLLVVAGILLVTAVVVVLKFAFFFFFLSYLQKSHLHYVHTPAGLKKIPQRPYTG